MPQVESIQLRSGLELRAASGWLFGLALSLAGFSVTCAAADSISGLGSAFRPQAAPAAPAAAGGEQAGVSLPGLRIVIAGKSRSVATIDGQLLHVGDSINGMRVTRIDPQGVELMGEDGAKERLLLHPSAVKREGPAARTRVSKGVAP